MPPGSPPSAADPHVLLTTPGERRGYHAINGDTPATNAARRSITVLHGTGLLIILIAGFGLVARLDLLSGGVPGWVIGKLVIWLLAGILLTVPRQKPALARPILLAGLPILAAAAAWLAVYKPGN